MLINGLFDGNDLPAARSSNIDKAMPILAAGDPLPLDLFASLMADGIDVEELSYRARA